MICCTSSIARSVAQPRQDSHHFRDVLLGVVLLVHPDWVDPEQDFEHLVVRSAVFDVEARAPL
jgi:hypothetical protein